VRWKKYFYRTLERIDQAASCAETGAGEVMAPPIER